MSVLSTIGKGLLSLIPGGGLVTTGLELAADIAGIVGGDTGKKISEGAKLLTEGLSEAGKQPMSPEQQAQLQEAGLKHKERMRELDLQDKQGGRDLAKAEIASGDEYVRRTRPQLLRLYGKTTLALIVAAVGVSILAALSDKVDKDEAVFIVDVLKWALPTVSGTFVLMYTAYTGRRTDEKMAQLGMQREGFMDKALKLLGGRK